VYEEHAVGDGGATGIERPAVPGNAVDRVVRSFRIIIPEDRSVARGVSTQVPVLGPGKHRARNDSNGSRLCRCAAAHASRTARRWSRLVPDALTASDIECRETARRAEFPRHHIGNRYIDVFIVGRRTPLDAP